MRPNLILYSKKTPVVFEKDSTVLHVQNGFILTEWMHGLSVCVCKDLSRLLIQSKKKAVARDFIHTKGLTALFNKKKLEKRNCLYLHSNLL